MRYTRQGFLSFACMQNKCNPYILKYIYIIFHRLRVLLGPSFQVITVPRRLSRSGVSSPEAMALVDELAAQGVTVQSVHCDVGVLEQVQGAIRKAPANRLIKGLIHAAISLQDRSFDKLSIKQQHESLKAKVHGTKNLHEATASLGLDFFVMTTSVESVLALATQSAYTAANNFQKVFARHRSSMGLPA